MFKEKTVFVLGAGASAEFDMPVGSKLKETIANKLNFKRFNYGSPESGDKVLSAALKKANFSVTAEVTSHFLKAIDTYDSIDEFLASEPDNEEFQMCGKLAIVRSILEAEADSKLYFSSHDISRHAVIVSTSSEFDFLKDDAEIGTFLGSFIRKLRSGVPINNIDQLFQNVSFINFNYDRCLERGLVLGLSMAYPTAPEGDATKWVKTAKIIRPYGSVGNFWSEIGQSGQNVPFGGLELNHNDTAERLVKLADGIKTFSENQNEIDHAEEIKNEIYSAETIVFLGFHFHVQNLELLSPDLQLYPQPPRPKKIFATAFERSPSDKNSLVEILRNLARGSSDLDNQVILEAGGCYDLFKNNQLGF